MFHINNILKHAQHAIFFAAILTLATGCRSKTLKDYGHNMDAINKEVKSRKIHRVSETEFKDWVTQKGSEVSRTAQKFLNRASNKAIEAEQISSPKEFAKLLPLTNIDSLVKNYQVTLQAISFQSKKTDELYDVEAKFLKQFKNKEIGLEPSTHYVENRRKMVFIAPIHLNETVGMWSIQFERDKVVNQIVKEREAKKKRKKK